MIDKSFLEKIEELSTAKIIEDTNGFQYSAKPLHRVLPPLPTPLELSSLGGLCEILLRNVDSQAAPFPLIINIKDFDTVTVCSQLLDDSRRVELYTLKSDTLDFPFGRYMPVEEMLIGLKSKFIATEDREKLMSVLGAISDTSTITQRDDGVTQSVEVRKGVALKGNTTIQPIVLLKPYRTFLEVEQPSSEFLVRIKEGGVVSLFEADSGMWRLAAKENIRKFITEKLTGRLDDFVLS